MGDEIFMKEKMYVITTRGRNGKEIYLKCSDKETRDGKILMEWTENIDDAMATFFICDAEKCAENYFKNFKKWYITDYVATFK